MSVTPIACGCGKRVSPRLSSCPYCRAPLRAPDDQPPIAATTGDAPPPPFEATPKRDLADRRPVAWLLRQERVLRPALLALCLLSLGIAGKRVMVPPPYGEAALFGSLKDRTVCVVPGDLAWDERLYELHAEAVVHAPTNEVPAERATVDAAELLDRRSELLGHVVRLRGVDELGSAVVFRSVWKAETVSSTIIAPVPGTDGRLFVAAPRELSAADAGEIFAIAQPAAERLVVLRPLRSVIDPDRKMATDDMKSTTARRALEGVVGGPLREDAVVAHELRDRKPWTPFTWIPLAGSSRRHWVRLPRALTSLPSETVCGTTAAFSAADRLHLDGPAPRLAMESRMSPDPGPPKRALGRALLDALPYLLGSLAAFAGFLFLPRREPPAPADRLPGSPYRA